MTAPTAIDNCAGAVIGIPDVSFPITASGTTTVTWTYDDGNGNVSSQVQNVSITPIELGTTTTEIEGDITLGAIATGYTYQWIENCGSTNDELDGETSQVFTPIASGSYAVIIDNGNCSVTSACVDVVIVGIEEEPHPTVSVYPNPTSGLVRIEASSKVESIELFDVLGKSMDVYSADQDIIHIRSSAGVYFLRIKTKTAETTVRVVKE